MSLQDTLAHPTVISTMLAPALLMAATGSLLALLGMACLFGAAIAMGREVSLAVRSLDTELDIALTKRRRGG